MRKLIITIAALTCLSLSGAHTAFAETKTQAAIAATKELLKEQSDLVTLTTSVIQTLTDQTVSAQDRHDLAGVTMTLWDLNSSLTGRVIDQISAAADEQLEKVKACQGFVPCTVDRMQLTLQLHRLNVIMATGNAYAGLQIEVLATIQKIIGSQDKDI